VIEAYLGHSHVVTGAPAAISDAAGEER
jgi:hypothetical protein